MKRDRGFTLIELVMFIVIVGIAVSGMVALFTTNVGHSHEPLLRQKAISLANFYMDEIIRKKWNHNSPAGGGCVTTGSGMCITAGAPAAVAIGTDGQTRSGFDDIDDYHNLNDSPPADQTGTSLTDFDGYSVTVAVTTGTAWDPLGAAARDVEATDILRIQVDVTVAATSETLSLIAYRSNF
jgi:MSHA pilin protein MshD